VSLAALPLALSSVYTHTHTHTHFLSLSLSLLNLCAFFSDTCRAICALSEE
jgi:hypothetical protein